MSLFDDYKNNQGLAVPVETPTLVAKTENPFQKAWDFVTQKKLAQIPAPKSTGTLFDQYQAEKNAVPIETTPGKTPMLQDYFNANNIEQVGWVDLESKGLMTPDLEKLKKAGFAPPVSETPVTKPTPAPVYKGLTTDQSQKLNENIDLAKNPPKIDTSLKISAPAIGEWVDTPSMSWTPEETKKALDKAFVHPDTGSPRDLQMRQIAYDTMKAKIDPVSSLFFDNFLPTKVIFALDRDGALVNEARQKINDEFSNAHPFLSILPVAVAQLANLALIGKSGGGFGLAEKTTATAGRLSNWMPNVVRMIGLGAESGSIFGIVSGISEALNQAEQQNFQPKKLLTETLKGVGTGSTLGIAGGAPQLWQRVLGSGGTLVSLSALQGYMQDGKIDAKDIANITINGILGAGFELIGGRAKTNIFSTKEQIRLGRDVTTAKLMENPAGTAPKTWTEAQGELVALEQLPKMIYDLGREETIKGMIAKHPDMTVQQANKMYDDITALPRALATGYGAKMAPYYQQIPKDFYGADVQIQKDYFTTVRKGVMEDGLTIPQSIDVANQTFTPKIFYSHPEATTPVDIHAENQATQAEANKMLQAKTGTPIELTGWNTSVGGKDSGFRSPDRYESQAYSASKMQFSNKGEVNVNKTTDKLNNPYVANDQTEVLKFLGNTDLVKRTAEELKNTSSLSPNKPIVVEADNYIRTELLKQGYDGVIYKNNGRRPEYQVFNVKKQLGVGETKALIASGDQQAISDEVNKRLEDFRQKADLMASNEGAGVRQYSSDQSVGETKIYNYFKLDRAKSDMFKQAKQLKQYAHELLYENDPLYKELYDKKVSLEESNLNAATDEIDVQKMFEDISKEEKILTNNLNKYETSKDTPTFAPSEGVKAKGTGQTQPAQEKQTPTSEVKSQVQKPQEGQKLPTSEVITPEALSAIESKVTGIVEEIKKGRPTPAEMLEKTPSDYSEIWSNGFDYYRENISTPAENEIKTAKKELATLKGNRTPEVKTRKAELEAIISKLEKAKNDGENRMIEETQKYSLDLADLAVKQAQAQGLDLGEYNKESDVSEWNSFKDDFITQISERPYIESNWNDKISTILDGIIADFKEQFKGRVLTPTPIEESATDIINSLFGEEPAKPVSPSINKAKQATSEANIEELVNTSTPVEIPVFEESGAVYQKNEKNIKTAKEAATDLIRGYVERGDTMQSLSEGQMGKYGSDYQASVGGYLNGKNVGNKKIIVFSVNGKEVNETFSLKTIFDEIKKGQPAQKKTQPTQELFSGLKTIPKDTVLFHGTSGENAKNIKQDGVYQTDDVYASYGRGFYLTDDKAVAQDYADELDNGQVLEFSAKKDLKLLTPTKTEREDIVDLTGESQDEMIQQLLGDNYDGFYLPDIGIGDGSPQVVLYNKTGLNFERNDINDLISLTQNLDNGIIKSYGQPNEQSNDVLGSSPVAGTLPEALPVGERQPSDTGGAVAEHSGQVAQRGLRVGGASARIGSQVSKTEQFAINNQIESLVAEKGDNPDAYSEEQKNLLSQYSGSGGLEEAGANNRGLLDEYFTPQKVVSFIWSKLKDRLPILGDYTIVEPSVGTGNFIDEAPEGTNIEAFEINKTSATIAKVLYPNAGVENAPFESLFIDDRGNKKTVKPFARLVIGNPPYGEHRGIYKGLGEEPRINRYEDYFIKRGLDITQDKGFAAMVVPSGFLRTASDYAKNEIAKLGYLDSAYRLPNNVFDNTDIGTDIVILRKEAVTPEFAYSLANRTQTLSDDNYFKEHPENILGVEKERKGRFGMEKYVEGSLDFTPAEETQLKNVAKSNSPQGSLFDQKEIVKEIENEIDKGAISNEKEFVKNWSKDVNKLELSTQPKVNKGGITISSPKKSETRLDLSEYYSDMSDAELRTYTEIKPTGEGNEALLNGELSPEDVINYLNLENGKWFNNLNYFTGDIYERLDQLEVNKSKMSQGQYKKQYDGLIKVLPEKYNVDRINISPNTPFADMTLKYDGKDQTLKQSFKNFLSTLPRDTFADTSRYEINEYVDEQSVRGNDKVRNQTVRVQRREIGNRLFSRFLREALTPEQTKAVEDRYNRSFNSYVRPDYRQVPLLGKIHGTFKGNPLTIKDYQLQGIGFLVNKGLGLIAHDVGLGKTMQSIIAINEMLKRGWAKKPLIVVPSGNVYTQWIKEVQEIIPGIEINGLTNLGGAFAGDLSTLEIKPGTISIITYEGFKKLGFKQETYNDLTSELQDTIEAPTGLTTARAKQAEQAKVQETIGKGIKGTLGAKTFEDLGFDLMMIDEVQNANHIIKGAKLQEAGKASEFRGLNIRPSELGIKAWLASQYILKNNNNRNVFLASATPFTNNPMEYYSVLSLLARERMKKSGLKNVNEFMNTFMDISFDFEITADGKYKERNNIKGFKNYQQFQKILTEFIDFRDGEEVGIQRPNRLSLQTTLKATKNQVDLMTSAQELFNDKNKNKGGALKGVGEMRAITFSPYASSYYKGARPTYESFVNNSPKVKAVVEMVIQNHSDNKDANQVIYSPIGVEYLPMIKDYLVQKGGFKADQVGIITGSVKGDERVVIQDRFNEGKVKVLIGSDAIQEGVNLQRKSTDLYIMALPWNFTELKQVTGRIWRQGNEWKNIRVHNVFIENSVDVFQSQKLETKQNRYENSLKFKGDYLDVGDIDFDELKMDLISSPVMRVAIEKSMEQRTRERTLNEAKSNLGFYSRKADKLLNAQEDLDSARQNVVQYTEWAKGEKDEYWSKRIAEAESAYAKKQKDYEAVKKDVEDKGLIDLNQLKSLENNVANGQKSLDALNKDFKTKEDAAVKQETARVQEITTTGNDYKQIRGNLAEQNKTFFIKNEAPANVKRSPAGLASAGGSKIGNFEQITSPDEADKLKIYDEVKALIQKYAQSIGESYLPRGAAGVLYQSGNIRVTGMNALSVATHEITHFLDKAFKISDQIMGVQGVSRSGRPVYEKTTAKLRKEMTDLYNKYYPTAKKSHKLSKRMLEGFATLLEKYIEQPTMISGEFPNLVREFLTPDGSFYEPVIGDIIKDVKGIIGRYQKLSPLDKIGARIINDKVNVNKESFLNLYEKIKTFIFHNIYPIEVLSKKSGTHFTANAPDLWLTQYNNSNAIITNNLMGKKGYWAWKDGVITKMFDFNWKTLVDKMRKDKVDVPFGNYLIARDQYYNYQELKRIKQEIDALEKQQENGDDLTKIISDTGITAADQLALLQDKYAKEAKVLENNGFTEQEVTDAYLAGQDKFTELEQMHDTLTKADLAFLHQPFIQLLNDEEYSNLTDKVGYASMKRAFYDEIAGEEGGVVMAKRPGGVKASSLMHRKGSERAILHPVYSGMMNHAEITRKGLKQIVYNKIGDVAEKFPELMQRLQLKVIPDVDGALHFPQEKDSNIIMARKDYKRSPILVDEQIKRVVDEVLTFQNINIFEKLVVSVNRIFVKGTTGLYTPFAIANWTVDQSSATAQTRNKYLPVYDQLTKLEKALNPRNIEHTYALEYMIAGGERQTFAGHQDASPNELFDIIQKNRKGVLKMLDLVNGGFSLLAVPSQYSELSTRMTEYIKSRLAGKPSIVALEEAGRVSAPFHHIGSWGGGRFWKTWIKSIPFANASFQVLAQELETLETPEGRKRYLFVMLATIAAAIAGMLYTFSAATEEQKQLYTDLNPDDLSRYIYLPNPNGKSLIKIRVPQEMVFIGTIINMTIMDRMANANYTAGEYVNAGTAWLPQQLNITQPIRMFLNWVPQFIKPAFETIANVKDYPKVMPLESQSQTAKQPENRFTPATSPVAKWLGQTFKLSPIKIDYLLTGYVGRASGMVTGKIQNYNPFSSMNQDYYFDSGRKLQTYYDLRDKNNQLYSDYKNKRTVLSNKEISAMIVQKAKLKAIDNLIQTYGTLNPDKQPKTLQIFRNKIINSINKL
ncbi:MAG: helicase-related protein [Candidatus Staskawiczbacteria bacterium]|nr:helicase-related protein [Candidatus Staskawiczbacteria bacterium]